jgi:hypothetical protein
MNFVCALGNTWIKGEKVDFERAWVANPIRCDKPMTFLAHLQEVDEMAKWVRNTIRTHQVGGSNMITDPNFVLLPISPSFTTLRYSKMKAYMNHF